MPDRQAAKRIFMAALDLDPAERPAFIVAQCKGDAALQREVEALLAAHEGKPILDPATLPAQPANNAAPKSKNIAGSARVGEEIGPYRLLERIGEGGFGEVWIAEQKTPVRRKVALKIIKAGMDTREVLARFEAERQALAVMDHPCVAKVFDAGATGGGRPYFVMEYVAGLPINAYCDSSRLRIKERLRLFMNICHAVQHAHQKGIIHRDLKPGNIIVTLQDGKPVPKVIDFGIAKATIGRLTERTLYTETGRVIGTPEYMAPEQAGTSGLDVDTRADIYSLGVILYELLTGTLPLDGNTLRSAGFEAIGKMLKEFEPPKPSTRLSTMATEPVTRGKAEPDTIAKTHGTDLRTLQRELRGDLDWITLKALEKDRTRRYETASAFAADVERHLTGEPVIAAPPSVGYRIRKFVRKHKGGTIIGATLLVSTFATSTGLVWAIYSRSLLVTQTRRAESEKERANGALWESQKSTHIANIYSANMLIKEKKFREARELLLECPDDERGFEWRFLNAEAQAVKFSLVGGPAAISPDGSRIATPCSDGTARIWDAATGRELLAFKWPYGNMTSCVFSADGSQLATTGAGRYPAIWDTTSGKQVCSLGYDDANVWDARTVAFSPLGSRLVTAFAEDVKYWDSITCNELYPVPADDSPVYYSEDTGIRVSFRNDGFRFVTALCSSTAQVWDTNTGREVTKFLGHTGNLSDVQFSPSGATIITAAEDKTARIWDSATGTENQLLGGHSSSLTLARFNHSGSQVVTTSLDSTARLWEVASGRQISVLRGHTRELMCADFSPDDRRVITGSSDGIAHIWDTMTGLEVLEAKGMTGPLRVASFCNNGRSIIVSDKFNSEVFDSSGCLAPRRYQKQSVIGKTGKTVFSPDGRRMFVRSPDSNVRLLDGYTGRELNTVVCKGSVRSFAFSPDGNRCAITVRPYPDDTYPSDVTSRPECVQLVDSDTGNLLADLETTAFPDSGVTYSHNGRLIATISEGRSINLWNALDGSHDCRLDQTRDQSQHCDLIRTWFSPDDKCIVATNSSGRGVVWHTDTRRELARPRVPTKDDWNEAFVVFSPSGSRMVVSSDQPRVNVIDLVNGASITLDGFLPGTSEVRFSSDGLRLVTRSDSGTSRLWNAHDGQELLRDAVCSELTYATSVELSPDGGLAAAVMPEGTINIYDLNNGMRKHSLASRSLLALDFLCFSYDGRLISTTDAQGSVQAWETRSGALIREWEKIGLSNHADKGAFSSTGELLAVFWGSRGLLMTLSAGDKEKQVDYANTSEFEVSFSKDGTKLVARTEDYDIVNVWDTSSGLQVPSIGDGSTVSGVVRTRTYNKGLDRVAVTTLEGSAYLLDCESGRVICPLWPAVEVAAVSAMDDSGTRLVTASGKDARAQVWDIPSGLEPIMLLGHLSGVCSVAISPDGSRVATGSFDATAKIWDSLSGTCVASFGGDGSAIVIVQLSPNHSRLLTGDMNGKVRLWNSYTKQLVADLGERNSPLNSAFFGSDGATLLTVSKEAVRIWDGISGKSIRALAEGQEIIAARPRKDGAIVAVLSKDQTIAIYDPKSGMRRKRVELPSNGQCVSFSESGADIAVGLLNGDILILDVESLEKSTFAGHSQSVASLEFSDHGRRLVSASHDRTIRIWDTVRAKELLQFRDAADSYANMWAPSDGRRIIATTANGTVHVWDSMPEYKGTKN